MARVPEINNTFYDSLGERWYLAQDDPVALLRAESKLRNPWIVETLSRRFGGGPCRVLDVGCGGGFLSNDLARAGHRVTGIDLSEESLEIARRYDETGSVCYQKGDAARLPFPDASFEAVCAMDFLEHVEHPERVIAEAARVLKKNGLFFFHTFNRNFLSRLVVIQGVKWFVKNTPENLHVYSLFIKPREIASMCERRGLKVKTLRGSRPKIFSAAFLKLLLTRRVPADFRFVFNSSKTIAYTGFAGKE